MAMGWLTRWAALALVIDMSVALFNEGSKGDPIELPALYLIGALTLMITGPGRFALDGNAPNGGQRCQRSIRRRTPPRFSTPAPEALQALQAPQAPQAP
jgi:hypothetical protein